MAYKRYFYRNGKKFGPYYYESYRDKNGKVRKKYIGTSPDKKTAKTRRNLITPTNFFIFLIILLSISSIGILIFKQKITGKLIFLQEESLLINLKKGELLPINSKLIIEQNNSLREILLSELIESDAEGAFYIENKELSGEGEGYGVEGEKIIYPVINFKFKLISEEAEEVENITETPTEEGEEATEEVENITETPTEEGEETTEIPISTPETTPITPTETPIEPAPELTITGEIVTEEEIEGQVSKDAPFTYNIEDIENKDIEITYVDKASIDELKIEKENGILTITTNYYEIEKGFGKDFLTNETTSLEIGFDELGIVKGKGNLTISLVAQDMILAEVRKEIFDGENITLSKEIENITTNLSIIQNISKLSIIQNISEIGIIKNSNYSLNLKEYFAGAENYSVSEVEDLSLLIQENNLIIIPDENFTGERTAEIYAFSVNEFVAQVFSVSVIEEINKTALNITTKQYKAVINRPVKWLKTLKINKTELNETALDLELPKQAENITIKTGQEVQEALRELEEYEQIITQTNKESLITGRITGDVSLEIKKNRGILIKFWNWMIKITITGKVIQEQELKEEIIETSENKIINLSGIVNQTTEEDFAVEYYTEAPTSNETDIPEGKRIVIEAPTELHYEDILAYTLLDNSVSINNTEKIKLYWIKEITQNETNQTTQLTKKTIREEVNFTAYDLDSDNFIDYIEWIVPYLSQQTYELIYITKAEHLDENRSFISNIYEEVKALDGNWSEPIYSGEYVRVTFEKPLDRTKDITIYARTSNCSANSVNNSVIINGTEVPCDIYQKKKRIGEIKRLLEE